MHFNSKSIPPLLSCIVQLLAFVSATTNITNIADLDLSPELLLARQADSASLASDAEFRRVMLASHMFYRSQHGAGGLTWNNERAVASTRHSRTCVFRHSGDRGAGENIAAGFRDVAGVVNAWGGERTLYNYFRPGFSSATGHFTQIVWKNTNSIGCGRTRCPGGMGWYVVCQYTPPGNVIGTQSFISNVGRQIRGRPSDIFSGQLTSASSSLGARSPTANATSKIL